MELYTVGDKFKLTKDSGSFKAGEVVEITLVDSSDSDRTYMVKNATGKQSWVYSDCIGEVTKAIKFEVGDRVICLEEGLKRELGDEAVVADVDEADNVLTYKVLSRELGASEPRWVRASAITHKFHPVGTKATIVVKYGELEVGDTVTVIEVDEEDDDCTYRVEGYRTCSTKLWVDNSRLDFNNVVNSSELSLGGGRVGDTIIAIKPYKKIEHLNLNGLVSAGVGDVLTVTGVGISSVSTESGFELSHAGYIIKPKSKPVYKYLVKDDVALAFAGNRENHDSEEGGYKLTANLSGGAWDISQYAGTWSDKFTNEQFDALRIPLSVVAIMDKVEVKPDEA